MVTVDHVFNNRAAVLSDNVDGIRHAGGSAHCLGALSASPTSTANSTAPLPKSVWSVSIAPAPTHGITVPDEYVIAGTYRDADRLRQGHPPAAQHYRSGPRAILFPDDFSAIGGVQAIREEGLLIPRDISVAGYDGNLISQVMSPQLTTYRQDTEAMGKAAAELLIEEIESPRTALPEQRLIAGSFARGESIDTPHR